MQGDGQRVILRQSVRGSVRAVRAIRNTRVFQTEIRVIADVEKMVEQVMDQVVGKLEKLAEKEKRGNLKGETGRSHP